MISQAAPKQARYRAEDRQRLAAALDLLSAGLLALLVPTRYHGAIAESISPTSPGSTQLGSCSRSFKTVPLNETSPLAVSISLVRLGIGHLAGLLKVHQELLVRGESVARVLQVLLGLANDALPRFPVIS